MRTEDLEAFFAIVEQGSLTAAARQLGVPKSTISRRLSRLEEELAMQLVLRTPRSTQISDLGRQLYRSGQPLLADLDEIARELRDQGGEPVGPLRVSAPEDLTTALMGRLCGRVLLRYPGLEVRMFAANHAVDLLADGIDVAVRIHLTPLADVHSLKVRRLGEVDIGLFAAPRYLEEHPRLRRPEQLPRHRCLTMASLGPAWSLRDARSGREAAVRVTPAMLSNDHHALRDAACEGAGITVAPAFLCAEAVAAGRLVRVLPRWSIGTATLSLLWPATRLRSPRIRAFVELAAEFFAEEEWVRGG